MYKKALVALSVSLVASACSNCGDNPPNRPTDDVAGSPDADAAAVPDVDAGPSEQELVLGVEETERISIPALREEVHIVRTAGDVPHIYASNEHDGYVAMGWALARDRYFEYDIASRFALGEVSQLLGRFGVDADVDARGRGMAMVAARLLSTLDEDTGQLVDAYAEGINAYVDAVQAGEAAPPSEYELAAPLLGQDPADLLRRADRRTMLGFAAFAVFSSSFTDHDLTRTLVREALEGHFAGDTFEALRQAGIEDLFEDTTPSHAISVAPGWGLNGTAQMTMSLRTRPDVVAVGRVLPPIPEVVRDRWMERRQKHALWFGTRNEGDKGSNAWAVAPDGTGDGSVLLAGDGHLGLGVPTLFFQMGIDLATFGSSDDLRAVGLFLPGFPFMAVGTNGKVAWSQTFPRADVMDWYREEVELDAAGLPVRTVWQAGTQDLTRVDETYDVAGVFGDDPQDLIIPRWATFDGRLLVEIEGRTVEDPDVEVLAAGESLVNMLGTWVVPEDLDADGVISGVSLDFAGYDVGNLAVSTGALQRSQSVDDFQENMKNFVGYAQNLVVADANGTIGFSPYTATPCRDYLPRGMDGAWVDGANPQKLLDGTQYGGFEIPVGPDGLLDPALAGDDPQKCVVPYDLFPRVMKDSGYVVNANNDPHGGSFDGTLTNDPAYIGGPWVPGYRANAIVEELEASFGSAGIAEMADAQADHKSQLGEQFVPVALEAIAAAKALQGRADAQLTADEIRLRDLYSQRPLRLDEVVTRLGAWTARGSEAASGVETFYNQPSAEDREDAVATMIFNVWIRKWIERVFADEQFDGMLEQPSRPRGSMMRMLKTLTDGSVAGNPMGLGSWNPATEESIYFDDRATDGVVERADEMAVLAMLDALAFLQEEPASGFDGGFGTTEMEQWLWGLKHRVVLDSILATLADNAAINTIASKFSIDTKLLPLAEDIPEGDPRRRLRWFPRPGDFFGADAANPSFFGDNFDYADGPVMRMVFQLWPDGRVAGQNVVPAGQSGLTSSEHYADQAALWLANDTLPVQFAPADVAAAATGREVLTP